MSEWNRIRKQNKKLECIALIIMTICLLFGGWCDWNVLIKDNVLIFVKDIDSFSLTILQIQASVGTLIIAIIALITGNISDSYMGVSISNFYLNIKPWKLTQKILIFILLGFSLAGVIFHSLKLYNIVFYMFVATLVAILLSIIEMYSAFKGRNKQNQEIEAYVNYILESDIKMDCKLNIYQNFVLDWKKELDSQDKQSYEKYHEVFRKCMLTMWNYGTDEGLSAIEQQSYSMAYCLLGSEKSTVKERGIEFIQDVYDTLWSCIYKCITNDEVLLNKYNNEFPLFTEICSELIQSMDELSIESVERRIRFSNLTDLVLRVAIWLKYEKENKDCVNETKYRRFEYNFSSEISEINAFARYVGYYLGKQKNKNNVVNYRLWSEVLKRWNLFSTYSIPEERAEVFLKSKLSTYFGYCYGMLVNGQEEVVKQGLYLQGMRQAITLDNKYQSLLYLTVHCYVYYLAEREDDDCVTKKIRQSAKNIWEDAKVREAFLEYLNTLSENSQWLDLDMLDHMYSIMDRYELFPENESVKSMIIEFVVSDFYIFLILFMSHEFYLPELLERNIDDMKAFRYVSDGNEKATKETFGDLFRMIFTGNKSDEQIEVEVNLMYDSLEKMVKKKQKERYVRLARESQASYEANIKEEEICKKIQRDTIQKIREKFAPILVENDDKNGVIKVKLLNLSDYTESIGQRSTDGFHSHMDGMFLYGIERFLLKRKAFKIKNRFDDFVDDKEFMEYLSVNDCHLLLGSQFILKNRDYKMGTEYKKFLNEYKTVYTDVVRDGIALKEGAIQVCLQDVNDSIHSPTIREANAEYNKETGKYNYSILNGLPIDFDEDELREFLYNNRKVINVTAKVSIQVNEKPVGTVFTGRKRI